MSTQGTLKNHGDLILVQLGQITGLHPRVLELDKEMVGIPPFAKVELSEEAIRSLLELSPIVCKCSRNNFQCVGNTRTYELAIKFLDSNELIPVHVMRRKRLVEIDKLYWAERLVMPMANSLGRNRTKWLQYVWRLFNGSFGAVWKSPPINKIGLKKTLASILGVSPGSLK